MTPETFEREMFVRLGRGYRLRPSVTDSDCLLIEQKIGLGYFDTEIEYSNDERERVRDGYTLVCACWQAPYIKCDTCHHHIPLPHLKVAEVRCAYCYSKGEKSMYFAGYMPLGEYLLKQLEATHPRRGWKWRQDMDAHNAATVKAVDRRCSNNLESIMRERHESIVGIPRTYLSDHRTY